MEGFGKFEINFEKFHKLFGVTWKNNAAILRKFQNILWHILRRFQKYCRELILRDYSITWVFYKEIWKIFYTIYGKLVISIDIYIDNMFNLISKIKLRLPEIVFGDSFFIFIKSKRREVKTLKTGSILAQFNTVHFINLLFFFYCRIFIHNEVLSAQQVISNDIHTLKICEWQGDEVNWWDDLRFFVWPCGRRSGLKI